MCLLSADLIFTLSPSSGPDVIGNISVVIPICPPHPTSEFLPCLFIHTTEAELHACSENLPDLHRCCLDTQSKSAFNPKPVSQQKCSVEATTQHFISWESLQAQPAGSQTQINSVTQLGHAAQPPAREWEKRNKHVPHH